MSPKSDIRLFQHRTLLEKIRMGSGLDQAPIHVRIEPTESCNFRCQFCWWHDPERKKAIAETADVTGKRHMRLDRLTHLVNELADIGTRAISFTGAGDPLVYPYLHEIISIIHSRGVDTGVTSNMAMPLKNSSIAELVNMRWLRWSLNAGTSRSYGIINQPIERNPDAVFERAKENIRRLVFERRTRDTGLKITTSYVVNNGNQDEIYDAVKISLDLGVDAISFRPDMNYERGNVAINIGKEFEKRIFEVRQEFSNTGLNIYSGVDRMGDNRRVTGSGLACYYSNHSTYISASGDVYPCCYTRHDKNYSIGNINESSFSDFWFARTRKNSYTNINVLDCPSCPHVETNYLLRRLYVKADEVKNIYTESDSIDHFV